MFKHEASALINDLVRERVTAYLEIGSGTMTLNQIPDGYIVSGHFGEFIKVTMMRSTGMVGENPIYAVYMFDSVHGTTSMYLDEDSSVDITDCIAEFMTRKPR